MKIKQGTIAIDNNMKDHSNDPFVKRKIEDSKKVIGKAGLPPEYLKILSERKGK
ncbi:hypothetical protein [Pedobacter frigoris]|uniref:hypothetical protein n=1 Tax=Pedobacter frigoris TaxID=2571272 RepID=UPI00292FAF9A|nr:hypothetical protein [Pedobacter frigoris]